MATEDKNIVRDFKNIFKDLCVTLDREYVDYKPGEAISLVRIDRENDYFLQGKDYLTQMVLLSTCNSFIAARCSGSDVALMMADHFENMHIFNLGRYNVIVVDDDKFML